ncbi:MAG: hypothetical protein Q7K21_03665 [Elusimicrobiota bacterium]|nr:hypothetical protein [Elusimicrobiota bacterium]
MKIKCKCPIFFLLLTAYYLSLTTCYLYAGISTTFADVVLENLQIGRSYNLRTTKNVSMIIKNMADETIDVNITLTKPEKDDLKGGYEPIPDTNWIQIVPNKYRLGPFEKGSSDVIITIPNDEKLIGRHFQIRLLSAGMSVPAPAGQLVIATGTSTRLRLSIGTLGPEVLKAEKKRKKMMTLDFEMDPVNIIIKEPIELGKKIDLRKEKGIKLNLINRATESVQLNMIVATDQPTPEKDYEIGNPKFLEIKPKKITLEGESLKKLELYLKIPDEEKYRNKKYVFFIKAEVPAEVPVEVFSKLFVTTGE